MNFSLGAGRRTALFVVFSSALIVSGCTQALAGSVAMAEHPVQKRAKRQIVKRAVVIGINDYAATDRTTARMSQSRPDRQLRNLAGAVNDATDFADVLKETYGFDQVELLLDQQATRRAILEAIEEVLIAPSRAGDQAVFFYAGHGSQRVNSGSDEPDKRDETLVPADSWMGADDIRDKELRRAFNEVLEQEANLTVVLDSCFSGSGVRDPAIVPRAAKLDPRDLKDSKDPGPPIEDQGAIVLSAAQDFQLAYETWDESQTPRGAFSLALLQALRSAGDDESAADVFARTRAWLTTLQPFQEPVLAGTRIARQRSLFGDTVHPKTNRLRVAVEGIDSEGNVILQAGWVDGLSKGSELVAAQTSNRAPLARLRVTKSDRLTRSLATVVEPAGQPAERVVTVGQFFELDGWTVPPGPKLPIAIPPGGRRSHSWAVSLVRAAAATGLALSSDPTEGPSPTHFISWRDDGWHLFGPDHTNRFLGEAPQPTEVVRELLKMPNPIRLFVEIPASTELIEHLEIGPGTRRDRMEPVDLEHARYVLTTRWHKDTLQVAWRLRGATREDRGRSHLPVRSRWIDIDPTDQQSLGQAVDRLEHDVSGLARVDSWLRLESPPDSPFPYQLELLVDEVPRTDGPLVEGGRHGLSLRLTDPSHKVIRSRYIYAFTIDSHGRCTLLYPIFGQGNVENHFPIEQSAPYPAEIPLGSNPLFEVTAPLGIDTYFLLTTVDPVPNPWVFSCSGVRSPNKPTPLEKLILQTGAETRGAKSVFIPEVWSISRLHFRSVSR